MKLRGQSLLVLAMVVLMTTIASAQESTMPVGEGMPNFGPPEEMQQMAVMVGDWHYAGQMKMSPEADWTNHEAEVSYSLVCGGAALQMTFTGMMMGMEMQGLSLVTFDRETKMWQQIWVDNFAARMSMYTGTFKDGKWSMGGEDLMDGQKMFTRTTTYDITDKEFKWIMENSMDGENWFISMRGVYIKK